MNCVRRWAAERPSVTLAKVLPWFFLSCSPNVALFFLQKFLQLHQQRWTILRVDRLVFWKVINEEDGVLVQKIRARNFPADFCTRNFGGGVSHYAATPLSVALPPGHSDITRFRPWSPIETGNHLELAEKIPNVTQTTGTVDVFDPHSGVSGPTSRRAYACKNIHEWSTQPTHMRCPVVQLLI